MFFPLKIFEMADTRFGHCILKNGIRKVLNLLSENRIGGTTMKTVFDVTSKLIFCC